MRSFFIIATIGFLALLCTSTFGQVESIDVLITPGLTSLRGTDQVKNNLDPRVRLGGGIGINYRLDEQWLVSVKLLYEDKGGGKKGPYYFQDGDGNVTQGEMKIRTRFKYLTLPVTAAYEFGNKTKFRAEAGPYVAFLMKQIFTADLDDKSQPIEDNTDKDKRADLGLSLGIRALLPVSENIALNIGVHDNLGLFNVSAVPVANNGSLKTNNLAFSIGLNFEL
jgi:hypothetical protein